MTAPERAAAPGLDQPRHEILATSLQVLRRGAGSFVPTLDGRMRQLTGTDATFIYAEGRQTPMHLTTMYIYDQSALGDGVVRHKDLLRLISSRLSSSPVFQQRLVRVPLDLDFPYWINDDNVDLEFHVRHMALPKPQDWRQLCVLAARLHSRPLDMTRPPWEINIIEGLDHVEGIAPNSFALLVKYHHAAVDGSTGNDILGGLTDESCERGESPRLPEIQPYDPRSDIPDPSGFELLARAAVNNVVIPFRWAQQVSAALPGLGQLVLRSVVPGRTGIWPAPNTRFNGQVGAHRVVQGVQFDFDDFRAARKAVPGATINDVVLAVCGGAIRQYLLDKDELPDDSLVAAVPISTRATGEEAVAGNSITMMMAELQSHVRDPLERLRAVHESTKEAKELTDAIGARQLSQLTSQVPASTMALAGRLVTQARLAARGLVFGNCVVTNVPGPQIPLYLGGAELVATYGFGPLIDGIGLLILATSYNGKMFLSMTSCRDMVDDPQFFAQCLQDSLDSLKVAAAQKLSGSAGPGSSKKDEPPSNRSRPRASRAKGKSVANHT